MLTLKYLIKAFRFTSQLNARKTPGLTKRKRGQVEAGVINTCGQCYECLKDKKEPRTGLPIIYTMMIFCPICGNKRCPKATDHRNECTNSNATGQKGSRYL